MVASIAVPGAGQVIIGHSLRGLSIFAVFGLAMDGVVLGFYGPVFGASADGLVMGAGLFAILLWCYSLYDVWRRTFGRMREGRQTEKAKHFRAGLVHYLSKELDEAAREFRFVLRLDDEDLDALFYLAMALHQAGRERRARRLFKRCLALDDLEKWRDEIDLHLSPPLAKHEAHSP